MIIVRATRLFFFLLFFDSSVEVRLSVTYIHTNDTTRITIYEMAEYRTLYGVASMAFILQYTPHLFPTCVLWTTADLLLSLACEPSRRRFFLSPFVSSDRFSMNTQRALLQCLRLHALCSVVSRASRKSVLYGV